MRYSVDRRGWHNFWLNNQMYLTPKQKSPFLKNFRIMHDIINDHFGTPHWGGKEVLEVGAGRGTISDLFHIRGCHTTCTDIENVILSGIHTFHEHDILLDVPLDKKFDIIVTYGLLEHYKNEQKVKIMWNCDAMLKDDGIILHYVVPKKWTNMLESSEVYRDDCKDIDDDLFEDHIVQVFPVFKWMDWVTTRRWSKGFIMWSTKA